LYYRLSVDTTIINTEEKALTEIKDVIMRSRSVIAHELKHISDQIRVSFKAIQNHISSDIYIKVKFYEKPKQYQQEVKELSLSLAAALVVTGSVEASVAANEVAAEIKAKKTSEFLTSAEFLALFNETRFVKKLNEIKTVKKSKYEELKKDFGSNFDDLIDYMIPKKDTRYNLKWKSMDDLIAKCNEILKKLARLYDLFAPPKSKKY
jgi:hypothetical protein